MTEFKIGDRVRYSWDGDEGPVKNIDLRNALIGVEFEEGGHCWVEGGELELVEPSSDEEPRFRIGRRPCS